MFDRRVVVVIVVVVVVAAKIIWLSVPTETEMAGDCAIFIKYRRLFNDGG